MAAISKRARYRDISRLGSGGMATVVLAEDMTLGRLVALKRVHALGDPSGRSRLRREALVGASLSHPNLVSVYDVVAGEDGEHVIVMEYVAGETLRDALRRRSGFAVAEAVRVIESVSAALDAIHRQGVVHRDVKPANILLGADGAVKLADLGIASAADRTRITTDGAVLGTFSYMAPEQLGGAAPTAAVDVYALSAVAFEVLSGRKARLEPNPLALAHAISTQPPPDLREVWPQAPRAAVELLARGMSREPSQRPRSAGQLAGRLRAALEPHTTAPLPIPARPSTPTRSPNARDPTTARGSAPSPEAPREPPSPGPSYEDDPAAAAGVQRAKRRDGGGAALLNGRAGAGAARQSPAGSKQPSGRRGTPTPPAASASASSARTSGAVIAAAPNPAARPSTDRGPRKGHPIPAKVRRPPVAPRRRGRSQGRILAAGSIALVAVAVLVAVAISGGGAQPRRPNGAPASRRSSPVSGPRSTAKTSGPLKGPANRTTATGTSSPPANSAAATGTSSTPANSAAATGTSSPPTNRTAATGTSSPPAGTSASRSVNAPAGSPVSAVESFYTLAASHRYAEAWALADPTFRAQLGGYHSFQAGQAGDRSITFDLAHILSRSSADATVAVHTTSVRTDGTQHCLGTVNLVSGSRSGGWMLHLIHINCN